MSNDPTQPNADPLASEAVRRARRLLDAGPEHIGPYRILETLGEGGMGVVYRAEQRSPFRREVVLKLIKLGMDTKLVIARFEAERQALAMMSHPHIAKVFDAGTDETGRPFFVMEYVKGQPVTGYADTHKLNLESRLRVFQQVCEAIQHAHHKGVVHRDLKPSNVLVTTQDGKPFAKVIDFGIAKAMNAQLTDKTLFTQHNVMIGTPEYMSPEQADGNLDIDTRTDVYSLGVLLYELLTGHTPFDAKRLRSAAYDALIRIIRDEDPPKPSTRLSQVASQVKPASPRPSSGPSDAIAAGAEAVPAIADLAGDEAPLKTLAKFRSTDDRTLMRSVRGELDWLVMKAMDKDRSRRYATPTDLSQDIDRYLNGETVEAAPPSWRYRARKFLRKHRGPVVVAASVAAALLLGLIATTGVLIYAFQQKARVAQFALKEASRAEEEQAAAYAAALASASSAMNGEAWPEARARLDAVPQRWRGWEWRFLRRQAQQVRFTLPGQVSGTAVSPDQATLLTWSDDAKAAQLYDSRTGQAIGSSLATAGRISHGLFSADSGSVLIVAENTSDVDMVSSIYRLDARSGKELGKPITHNGVIHSIEFSPNAKLLLTACDHDVARLWDAVTGEPVGEQMKHEDDVNRATFGAGGARVLTMSDDHAVRIWDARTCTLACPAIKTSGAVRFAAMSADGTRVLTSVFEGPLQLWDGGSGEGVGAPLAEGAINVETFSRDGRHVLGGTSDGVARVWSARDGTPAGQPMQHPGAVEALVEGPDGRTLATRDSEGTIRLWSLPTGDPGGEIARSDRSSADVMQFSPDGQTLFVSTKGGSCRSWDVRTGRPLGSYRDPVRPGMELAGHLDLGRSAVFASGAPQGMAPFVAERAFVAELHDLEQCVYALGTDVERGVEEATILGSASDRPESGRQAWIARAGSDGAVHVLHEGQEVARLVGHGPGVRATAFHPDGTRIVTAGDDRTLRIWDTATWRELFTFRLRSPCTAVRIAPDGLRLVLSFADGSAEVWDARPATDRQRDREVLFADRLAVRDHVRQLLARSVPFERTMEDVKTDASLTPARRAMALAELQTFAGKFVAEADQLFAQRDPEWTREEQRAEVLRVADPTVAKMVLQKIDEAKHDHFYHWDAVVTPGSRRARYEEAFLDLSQQLRRPKADNDNLVALGYAQYRLGRFEEALATLSRPEAIDPYSAGLPAGERKHLADWAVMALCHWKLGRADEAKALLEKFRAAYAATDDARKTRYVLLAIEAVTTIDPDALPDAGFDAGRLSQYAYTVGDYAGFPRSDYEAAFRASQQAVSQDDAGGRLLTMALTLYRLGRYEESMALYDRAAANWYRTETGSNGPNAFYWAFRAMTEHQLGRAAEARASLDRMRVCDDWHTPRMTAVRNEAIALVESGPAPTSRPAATRATTGPAPERRQ